MLYRKKVIHSDSIKEGCERLMTRLECWADACIREHETFPAIEMHDQLTYTISFVPLIYDKKRSDILEYMKHERDKVRDYYQETNQWKYGYWAKQEVHHGTEHFELFLRCLYHLDPQDEETKRELITVGDLILGKNDQASSWFDKETGLFRSMYLGTEIVGDSKSSGLNVAEHFRMIRLTLLAYEITKKNEYLEFSKSYARAWADAIVRENNIPLGLSTKGILYQFDCDNEKSYRDFAGMIPTNMDRKVDRAENMFASHGVDVFLELYQITKECVYLETAKLILDELITQISDPDAGCICGALRLFRKITNDTRYDDKIIESARRYQSELIEEIALEKIVRPGVKETGRRESGIGKRADLSIYYENQHLRTGNAFVLALAAEILDDTCMATTAINLADSYFALAIEVFPSGRYHGCSAQTVSAIARGHGRDNNAGVITQILIPIRQHFCK